MNMHADTANDTAQAVDTTQPMPVMIALADIDASDRLRPVDPDWAAAIGASMEMQGQQQPIIVRRLPDDEAEACGRRYRLVVGGHRYAGAELMSWERIRCELRDISALEARLLEIDENLVRRELTALDRAVFFGERKRVWEELHPDAMHGGDRKSRKIKDNIKSQTLRLDPVTRYTADAAKRIGMSERTIQASVALAGALSPEAIALLRGTPLANNANALKKIAAEAPRDQLLIIRSIANREAATINGARQNLGMVSAVAVDPQEVIFTKLVELWSRANAKTMRRFDEHREMMQRPVAIAG